MTDCEDRAPRTRSPGVAPRFVGVVVALALSVPAIVFAQPSDGPARPTSQKQARKPRAVRHAGSKRTTPKSTATPAQDPVAGDAKDTARKMAREALDLMHQSRWAEAQPLLARAYALVPAPTIALLEGKALEQMGKLLEARDRYDAARHISPDETSEAFVEAAKEAAQRLEFLDRRIPKVAIVLEQDEKDARVPVVSLDGASLTKDEWSVPRSVNPGEHVVAASLGGDIAVEDHVLVKETETKQVYLRLRRPVPIRRWTPPLVAARPPPPSNPTRTWGFVALGAGAAGLVTGVTAGLVMLNAKSTLDHACSPGCPPDVEGDLSRFRTARLVSTIGYGVGAVGLAVGGSLLLFGPSPSAPEPVGTVRIGLGPGTAYVRGSF